MEALQIGGKELQVVIHYRNKFVAITFCYINKIIGNFLNLPTDDNLQMKVCNNAATSDIYIDHPHLTNVDGFLACINGFINIHFPAMY